MESLPLFVFGTLCRGHCNHREYLEGKYRHMLPATLRAFRRIHPLMIVPSADGAVDGELYFLRPETAQATLRHCDSLEGIPPGTTVGDEYRRMRVEVQTPEGNFPAWAYVHPDT